MFKQKILNSPFLKDFRNYLTGDIFTKILSFVSIAIFTRILTVEDYGIYGVFNTSLGLLLATLTLGFHTAVSRYFFEDQNDLNAFLYVSMLSSILIVSVFFGIVWYKKDSLAELLNLPSELMIFFYPAIIVGIISSIFSQYYSSLRESAFLTKIELFKAYFAFLLSLGIVTLIETSYLGLVIGGILSGCFVAFYMLYRIKPLMQPLVKKKHLIYIATFSIPLIPYTTSSLILQQFDRVMINAQLGNFESGLFNFAGNISMLYLMFTALVLRAFAPDYFNLMNAKNYITLDKKVLKIFNTYVFIAILLIFYGSEIAFVLADKKFHSALSIIPVLIIGYVFFSIYEIYGRNAVYAHKTIYASINILLPGILNVCLNYLFIPKYGNLGASLATLISYMVMAFLGYFISKYIIKVHTFDPLKLLKPLFLLVICLGAFQVILLITSRLEIQFILKTLIILIIARYLFQQLKVNHADS